MLEVLILVTLFVRPIHSAVLLFFRVNAEPGQMALVYIAVAAIDYIYILKKCLFTKKVKDSFLFSVLILGVILFLMCVTGITYGALGGDYLSYVMIFASLGIASYLLGYVFVQQGSFCTLGKVLPFLIIILTGVVTIADFMTLNSWDGLVHSKLTCNIDYQNCTYYAAYALGLNMYYLFYAEQLQISSFAKRFKVLFIFMLPLQLFVIMTAGGRGGFLLGGLVCVYFLFLIWQKYERKPAYILLITVAILTVGAGMAFYLARSGGSIRGFSRILGFLEKPVDNNRENLYAIAISYFLQSPLVGNGIGAVWFTVGYYSHNIFCDLLCETGIIGTGMFLWILYRYLVRTQKMIKRNSAHQFGFLIFIFVFVMLLFSGYYLGEPMLWFALAYTFGAKKSKEGKEVQHGKRENNACIIN